MKITRRQLRKLIIESRDDHIQGITDKLLRLEDELRNKQDALDDIQYQAEEMMRFYPDDPFAGRDEMMQGDPIRDEIYHIKRKIDLLQSQLDALEGAVDGPVGQLPRGKMFETRIKPSIPNIPSDDSYTKIDKLARDPEYQHMADSMAGAFGYPEDRSYVKDLKTYDVASREIFTDVYLKPFGDDEDEVTVVIPMDLVDNIIEAHGEVKKLEAMLKPGYPARRYNRVPFDQLRDAGMDIYRHIHDQLDGKYGRDNYDIYDYGVGSGYRSEGFNKAMEKFGEVY